MTREELVPVLATAGIHLNSWGTFKMPCYQGARDSTRISYTLLVGINEFTPLFAIPITELTKDPSGSRIGLSPSSTFTHMKSDRGFDWVRPAIVKARLECGV